MSAAGEAQEPLPPLQRIPAGIACVDDYAELARERMSAQAWAWLQGGAADELTVADNTAAFRRLKLHNRVLADLAGGHTRTTLLDVHHEFPILLAPVAHQRRLHPDAERASALGAAAMRAGMVLACGSDVPLEEIAAEAASPLWYQLYAHDGREALLREVRRAEAVGCGALVLTVDAPVAGPRNREQRAGPVPPVPGQGAGAGPVAPVVEPGHSLFDSPLLARAPTWRDVEWLCTQATLPVLLKGITAPQDALRALEAGIGGVVVSNHGGRVLDTRIAAIDALPAIADAIAGRIPLLLDGGIRRGTDVLKALALGAQAVLVGRPYLQALAAAGAPGVAHVLHLLRVELEMAMVQCGCATLDAIDASLVAPPAADR